MPISFHNLPELINYKLSLSIEKDTKTFVYEVYKIMVVEPEQLEVLNQTEDAQITLITCTPMRSGTHRLIIKGKMIS